MSLPFRRTAVSFASSASAATRRRNTAACSSVTSSPPSRRTRRIQSSCCRSATTFFGGGADGFTRQQRLWFSSSNHHPRNNNKNKNNTALLFSTSSSRSPLVAFPDLPLATPRSENNKYSSSSNNNNTFAEMSSSGDHDEDSSSSSSYTPYEQWVRRLYMTNLFHPVKLGLQNIEQLYEALGRPLDDTVVIHVAGTNGKGSVVYKLAQTLQLLGSSGNDDDDDNNNNGNEKNRVGMFVSPHISSFRERMQVNNECITEEEVVELLPRIYDLCILHDIPATFFEITTALAFSFFAKRRATVVVLETGLGGRLDATNVLTNRAVVLAIITSIGLEHTRILGDTVELIAAEKGGIIKPDRPVLVGPNVPHAVLRQCAEDKHASAYHVSDDIVPPPPMAAAAAAVLTDYDQENARIAKAALELLSRSHPDTVRGLTNEIVAQGTSVRPPCRFETVKTPAPANGQEHTCVVVLDVAHNPPAMDYLQRQLHSTFDTTTTKFRMVVGMSNDKDLRLCAQAALATVQGDATRIHLVQAAHPRAALLEDIMEAAAATGPTKNNKDDDDTKRNDPELSCSSSLLEGCHVNWDDPSVTFQVEHALSLMNSSEEDDNNNKQEVLVICGSVFLMAEAREALGFDEPRDSKYIAEVAGAGSRHGQENFGNSGGITTLSSTSPP